MLKNPDQIEDRGFWCGESGIGTYRPYIAKRSIYSTSWEFDGRLSFRRFGIYFHLFAEAASNVSGVFKIYIQLTPVYYHARCSSSAGPYNVSNYQSSSSQYYSYQKYHSYQGSRNLNKVYFRGRIKVVYTHSNGTVYTKYTPYQQIRVNY